MQYNRLMTPATKGPCRARVLLPAVAAWSLTLLLSAPAGAAVPAPPPGQWARTSLALLGHGQTRCAEIGEGILRYWSTLSGSEERQRNALDLYVLERTTGDMASAREALDIARRFLAKTTQESDADTAAALLQLFEASTQLCNTAAQPAPPRADFEAALVKLRGEVGDAESLLSRLVAASSEVLAKDLEPYLPAIKKAAERAEEKNRRDLAVEPEEVLGPTPQEIMVAWHQAYAQAVAPTKLALRHYLEARRANDGPAIQASCRELLTHVQEVLDRPEIFQAPDEAVAEPLQSVYRALRLLGGQCTAGRFDQVDEQYSRMTRFLRSAAEALAPYQLQP